MMPQLKTKYKETITSIVLSWNFSTAIVLRKKNLLRNQKWSVGNTLWFLWVELKDRMSLYYVSIDMINDTRSKETCKIKCSLWELYFHKDRAWSSMVGKIAAGLQTWTLDQYLIIQISSLHTGRETWLNGVVFWNLQAVILNLKVCKFFGSQMILS